MLFKKKNMKEYILLITYAICLVMALVNIRFLLSGLGMLMQIVMPILIGIAIAFVLNIPMSFCERYILKFMNGIRHKKLRVKGKRAAAIVLTFVFIALIITAIVTFMIPQLQNSIGMLVVKFPGYVESFNNLMNQVLQWLHLPEDTWNQLTTQWQNLFPKISNGLINAAPQIVNTTMNITQGVFNFVMGFIISIYMLADKERLLKLKNKLMEAYIPKRPRDFINDVGAIANQTFHGFIAGQITEAFILGLLCALGLAILRVPYALLIGVLVGVTSIVPVFGVFIGSVLSGFILLVVSPWYCLIFVIYIICLQQLESNVIYPKVVGSSVGISGLWVLIGMLLGGSFFGFTGIILGIPGFAVLYSVLRTITNSQLKKRQAKEGTQALETDEIQNENKKGETTMRHELKTIDPEELEVLLAEESGNVVLVDIREKKEIQNEFEGQDNVINIPLKLLPEELDMLEPFKDKTIVLICRSGNRATKAQILLEAEGFTNIRVLKGGVMLWEKFLKRK